MTDKTKISESYKKSKIEIIYRFILDYGIYALALAVVLLNFSLIFDNVVWGDEAFSANTIYNTGLYGVYQKIFFWDNHPPLYYYWLKLLASIFGYRTWVYHLASVIPFAAGILLSVTIIRKKLGSIPASFFSLISGLSFTCSEYNLEIRMYELCFFFVLLSICFSYRILENTGKKRYWTGLVVAGVLAAYTHYYGMVATGILLFVTSLVYFIMNRGKTWLYGVISIFAYLALYGPWLYVLVIHTMRVEGKWWMEAPETLGNVMNFMFGGFRMSRFLIPATFILTFVYILSKADFVSIKNVSKGDFLISFRRPAFKLKDLTADDRMFVTCYMTGILVLCFAYGISYIAKPMVACRYTYPLVPFVIMIWALAVKKLIGIFAGKKNDVTVTEKDLMKTAAGKAGLLLVLILWMVVFVMGLMDFKLQRSIAKVQDAETASTLQIIGTPGENTAFTSEKVQHLSWTVLYYYYPENEIHAGNPLDLTAEHDDIWACMGYELGEDVLGEMSARGFKYDLYKDKWIGKYSFDLYHFYKA